MSLRINFGLLLMCLMFCNRVYTQDTLKKIPTRLNRNLTQKSLTVQQAINNKLNVVIDSVIEQANGKALFVKDIISNLESALFVFWRNGQLNGSKPKEAYFVQCGPQTMTQSAIKRSNLIVLVGIALIKPAEFDLLRFERKFPVKTVIIIN